jgi:hypothetical protein
MDPPDNIDPPTADISYLNSRKPGHGFFELS